MKGCLSDHIAFMLGLLIAIYGHKHPEQTISTRLSDQIKIAVGNFDLILPKLPTLKSARSSEPTVH